MNVDKLDKMFHPGSVAVIGANEREGSIGAALMKSLMQGGYAGKILPVNPNCRKVFGMDACDSVMELGTGADLAVIATPIEIVPEIIRECGQAGVSGAVILSAGGRETGAAGHAVEEAIQREAEISGIRVMGPNCIGLVCGQSKLNASFAGQMPLPGRTAFISQSGSIYTAVLDLALREKIGFSHFVSLGSMSDVDFGDVIDYLGGDSQVGSILIYVESLNRFRNFMSAARSVARVKPIIAMKAGRSRAGIVAAASHTGAMSGEDAVYDAAFRRAGIVRVQTFEELFDCAELLAKAPPPSGPRLTIITNAGGPGVIATDSIDHHGGEAARMSPEILEKLDAVLPSCWSRGNPVDILANASPEQFRAAVEICLDAPESDGLLIILAPHALSRPSETAYAMAELLRGKKTPVVTSWMGGPAVAEGRDILNQAGIPTFDTPERAVRAFMDLYRRHRRVEMLQEIPPALPGNLVFEREKAKLLIQAGLTRENGLLTETESKSLLAAYGIPVNRTEIARTPDEAWERACEMGGPVALKIFSTDISHKTDVGGVQLELETETDIRRAWDRIMSAVKTARPDARIDGVTVQPMLGTPGYELILGARKSPGFGPVILFGMGGVMTEIHRDHAIALPPLNRLLARRLMEGTRVWQLLQGFRCYPAADISLLEEILIRLSQLVTDFPEISELDINPLAVTPDGIQAADARVIVAPSDVPAPYHLVISPYPNQHEAHVTLRDDMPVFVRPIRPEDAPLLEEMFKTLSPRSVYYRFFAPLKSLRHSMLARFTQIDYDREIALVAISETGGSEKMLGVGRIIAERGGSEGEFAVTVGELWHGKGIGAELLQRCLDIALERGMEKVWGIVLPENRNMLALGKKLGFKIRTDPESGDYLLSISFAKPDEHTGG